MSDDLTPLSLPTTLPYPITLSRLHARPSQSISRGSPLISYTFTSSTNRRELSRIEKGLPPSEDVRREDVREGDMSAVWESGIEGEFVKWEKGIEVGRVVERKHASKPVVWLRQACTHPVQLHGLCGICGADLTSDDYLTMPPAPQAGPSRHGGFEMSHDAMGVTVSSNEAKRLDSLTRDTLLSNRKLSLIVDLDQTIIHTTVDPTVGEWMAEIAHEEEEEEISPPPLATAESAGSAEVGTGEGEGERETTTPPGSPKRPTKRKRRAEPNPNAEALKDVARFTLADDPAPGQGQGRKGKQPERYYYTKPRPGLQKFLDTMSQFYEMHVYTMGTRTYADAICKVIDPEGRVFGDRILSRDESGNFTSKNLKRLFPTDQSMVVVIDDRQDVWGDCPNLLKVVPYEFFDGIGDINGTFLPPTPKAPSTTPPAPGNSDTSPTSTTEVEPTSEEDGLLLQQKLMDDVSETRPLAKLQKQLESDSESSPLAGVGSGSSEGGDAASTDNKSGDQDPPAQAVTRKPLLNNMDNELDRLSHILRQVHTAFYDAFDARDYPEIYPLPLGCDVEVIVPDLKAQVLRGCHLIFSGVISRDKPAEASAIWQTAETFGAIPSHSLTAKVTHCVAANLGTEKTYRASKLGVPVVWQGWFWESVNLWKKQDEKIWLAIPDKSNGNTPGASTPTTPALPTILLANDAENGNENGEKKEEEGGEGEEPFEGDEGLGDGWDDEAQAELDAFLDGSSDFGSDAGSERTDMSREGTPGTPSKKRVRYADEEQLPLETFKDPSPNRIPSPPKKRSKPLLLEAPNGDENISEANKFMYKASGSYSSSKGDNPESGSGSLADEDEDEEDDFEKMLRAEMDEE